MISSPLSTAFRQVPSRAYLTSAHPPILCHSRTLWMLAEQSVVRRCLAAAAADLPAEATWPLGSRKTHGQPCLMDGSSRIQSYGFTRKVTVSSVWHPIAGLLVALVVCTPTAQGQPTAVTATATAPTTPAPSSPELILLKEAIVSEVAKSMKDANREKGWNDPAVLVAAGAVLLTFAS